MVRHILLLQQRPDATTDEVDACRTGLAGLVGQIPGLLDFHWGANFAPIERRDGFTHGFSMDFADRKSLEMYGPHPQHQVVAARVRATFSRVIVFDFEL